MAYYIVSIGFLFLDFNRFNAIKAFLAFATILATVLGFLGFALGATEFFLNRKGRVRNARAAIVCGVGAIFPAWSLVEAFANNLSLSVPT